MWRCALAILTTGILALPLLGQETYDPSLFQGLKWRNVGPFRGGRAVTAAGVPTRPLTFYMGATGGGVWKTENGGLTWRNISDGYMKTGSVGSIAVSLSDPNVIYAGMGEACVRVETTTHGDGVYKSTDAGKTWTHLGLDKTRHIAQVRIHPEIPDLVYVAAQGSQWHDHPERGVYRSRDGGRNWEQVLFLDQRTGANDLSMDPTNPRILYASLWDHRRKPWHGYQMTSGGPGSGLYKTTDGGETWEKLTGKGGLPAQVGKIGVSVSPANPDRVFAVVEAQEGGIYRSDDAGKSWKRVNSEHVMTERTAYYAHIYADPQDEDTVYVMNAPFLKSTDGGVTFERIEVRHGDNHELWIHPHNNRWMIGSNDGGASITYDGGKTWSTEDNQPTGQFYRVITDDLFPYNLYGGQQDNTTVKIASQSMGPSIGEKDWRAVGGGESAHLAFDPENPRLIYAGSYQGQITEYDSNTDTIRNIMRSPLRTAFREILDYPIRFAWNAPILVSVHDPGVIYHAGNKLLKSTDRGKNWQVISPDLTRNETQLHGRIEGPFITDGVGGGTYNTIFYVAESPHQAGTIYVGTDDGLVQVTRDSGANWTNITPSGIDRPQINSIEISPHDPATAYLAATNYKFGDFTPLVFKTEDYGRSWSRIVNGIREEDWARVVREDPKRRDLLYLGTEGGLYISFDGGNLWQPFQQNLPVVPITDLRVHHNDLVAATQGRAFWILDDLTPLRQLDQQVARAEFHLFRPAEPYRIDGRRPSFRREDRYGAGENPPDGAIFYYAFKKKPESAVRLEILDGDERIIRIFSSEDKETPLPLNAGMNRLVWDLRSEEVAVPQKDLDTYRGPRAYRVIPGTYKARLVMGEESQTQDFEVRADPRLQFAPGDWDHLRTFTTEIFALVEEVYDAIQRLRGVNRQLEGFSAVFERDPLGQKSRALVEKIQKWEDSIVQTRQEFYQENPDPVHSPDRLDFDLIWLMTDADRSGPPLTEGSQRQFARLQAKWKDREAEMEAILEDLNALNREMRNRSLPEIVSN